VSIHVPVYNEPPQLLTETLDALARLDYPDSKSWSSTTTPSTPWCGSPSRSTADGSGARFRFFHIERLAGFKAGALNFALRHTDPRAEIVAVIDADYVVQPGWLRDLVPAFASERTGVVQAPQDYRDAGESAFKAMCHAEYRGFFHIGMVTRNERNAIIQHGTMTLVRRSLLERIGWAEWCITEDAELGLRIFEEGYDAVYIPQSSGRGVMPDNFLDFKKQRRARLVAGYGDVPPPHPAAARDFLGAASCDATGRSSARRSAHVGTHSARRCPRRARKHA
jgi:cellulose synthase/poly-beta-1,6-N-acetylglucosamine synthase-like glycosyltransferase